MATLKPFDKINIVRQCTGLTVTQKCLLLIIATHLGKNDFAFISISTLQLESCLAKRNTIIQNLKVLIALNIVFKLSPSDGYLSNRYAINFDLLVSVGYQCSNLQGLPQSLQVTRVVPVGYPKRNIKSFKRNQRANPVDKSNGEATSKADKARAEIRETCGLRKH